MVPSALLPVLLSFLCAGSAPFPVAETAVLRSLDARGWAVGLADCGLPGEADLRLLAVAPGAAVTVELLCPSRKAAPTGPWHAVRVAADGARVVWRGPVHGCPPEVLRAFVADLATLPELALAERYEPRG